MKLPWVAELAPFLAASVLLLCGGLVLCLWAPRLSVRLAGWALFALGAATAVLFLVFFRDPARASAAPADKILSPADGIVVKVERGGVGPFLDGPAWRVVVFMNLSNVHVQRVPSDARLVWTEYRPGGFWPAFLGRAARLNEQRWYGFERGRQKYAVVQIAGLLARRIVAWVRPPQDCVRGQRLGMIAFGSEVDLYLPLTARVTVRPGERVRAGETEVGEWR